MNVIIKSKIKCFNPLRGEKKRQPLRVRCLRVLSGQTTYKKYFVTFLYENRTVFTSNLVVLYCYQHAMLCVVYYKKFYV